MSESKELIVLISGQVTETNIIEYKSDLIAEIKASKRELVTDDDFVAAEKAVKYLKGIEDHLKVVKQQALQQAEEIHEAFKNIDELDAVSRDGRLYLSKQIKDRKAEIKNDLIIEFSNNVADYYDQVESESMPFATVLPSMFDSSEELEKAIKGLRTIDSMREKLTNKANELKSLIDERNELFNKNQSLIDEIAEDKKSLFQDRKTLLSMQTDLLVVTIEKRISADELAKLKIENEKKAKQPEQQAEVVETVKTEPRVEQEQKPPTLETSSSNKFMLKVLISCDQDKAIEFAQMIEKQHGENPIVKAIDLAK